MADELSIKMTGDAATLAREIDKLNEKIAKQKDELKALQDGYKKAGDDGEKGADRVARATDAAAKATWEQNRAIQQVKQGWKEQADAAEKVQESMDPSSIAAYATAFVGGFASIQKAIQFVNAELQNKIELQDKAKGENLTAEEARATLIQNMPGTWTTEQKKQFLAESSKLASETSIPVQNVDNALSQTLSATGGNAKAALSAARTAGKYMAAQPSKFDLFAGSMADLQNITGSDDSEVGLGLLQAVGIMSRTVKAEQKATAIPKAMVGMKAFGSTMQQSAALFGALSTASVDVMGDQTKTATIQLAKQLEEFLPSAGRAEQRIGGLTDLDLEQRRADEKALAKARERKAAGRVLSTKDLAVLGREEDLLKKEREAYTIPSSPALKTMGERIEYLWKNPAEAARFLTPGKGEGAWKGMTLEAGAIGPVREMLTDKNSYAGRLYRENVASLPDISGLKARGQQAIKDLDIDPSSVIGKASRSGSSAEQEMLIGNRTAAMAGAMRDVVEKNLAASGMSAVERENLMIMFNASNLLGYDQSGMFTAESILRYRKGQLEHPKEKKNYLGGIVSKTVDRAPTEQEKLSADALQKLIDELQGLRSDMANRQPTLSPPDRDR